MRANTTKGNDPESEQVTHLPPPWPDEEEYDRLYREVSPIDLLSEHNRPWREVRVPPGSAAGEVYQRLPSALKFEYGGYLTRGRIFYRRCERRSASVPSSKPCTFHSHPTAVGFHCDPDLPSPIDVRTFLLGRHRRTITVGRSLLWVWDKTERTLPVVRRFAAWEKDNLALVAGRLIDEGRPDWEIAYAAEALRRLGVRVPEDKRRWARAWPQTLRDQLGLTVTIHERETP
jgi:hypothetical protein